MRPDMAAIRARCEAATPEPWGTKRLGEKLCTVHSQHDNPVAITATVDFKDGGNGSDVDEANADFIAAARTDLPALVLYAEEMEARVRKLETALHDVGWVYPSLNVDTCWCENPPKAESDFETHIHDGCCLFARAVLAERSPS